MTLETHYHIEPIETGIPIEIFDILIQYPEFTDNITSLFAMIHRHPDLSIHPETVQVISKSLLVLLDNKKIISDILTHWKTPEFKEKLNEVCLMDRERNGFTFEKLRAIACLLEVDEKLYPNMGIRRDNSIEKL